MQAEVPGGQDIQTKASFTVRTVQGPLDLWRAAFHDEVPGSIPTQPLIRMTLFE